MPTPEQARPAPAAPAESPAGEPAAALPRTLTDAVAYRLRIAQEASFEAYIRRVGNQDLRPGRYSILLVLADHPGIAPTALSRMLGRDKSTLTSTLRDLETRGLIARSRRAHDRRSYGVTLTEAGRSQLDLLRTHATAHDRVLDRIVGADKADLMAILDRIARALRDNGAHAGPVLVDHDRT